MREKDLIKQLKMLRQAKPNKSWVSLTKKSIFNEEMECVPTHSWLFLHRPSFIVGAGAVGLLTILLFVGTLGEPAVPTDIDYSELASIASALGELEASLEFVSVQLAAVALLDVSSSPDEILVIKQTVESTIVQGEEFLARAKAKAEKFEGLEESYEVLTALAGAESALEEMKEINLASEKQVAERELTELKSILLNDRQAELLERAQALFNKENYQEALMTIIEISQNN